jgi:hypothetical protein
MNFLMKILFLALFFVMVFGCKKEKPTLLNGVDPCISNQPTTGDFLIEEMTAQSEAQSWNRFTNTDTIFKGRNVRFRALEDSAEYTWYIGNEVLYTQSVTRYFGQSLANTNIPITLVTRKTPNTLCFPDETGFDSITKVFHISNLPTSAGYNSEFGTLEGTFRMKSSHLADSFDITIKYVEVSVNEYFNVYNYDGLGNNCIEKIIPGYRNYRELFGSSGTGTVYCDGFKFKRFHVGIDGLVKMEVYFYHEGHPDYKAYTYLGRRI